MIDKNQQIIDSTLDQEYKYGFTTDIEQTTFEPGLNEEVITSEDAGTYRFLLNFTTPDATGI